MALVGYARISTEEQSNFAQVTALQAAGCVEIHEEQASGGSRSRPVLTRALQRIGKGDTLVVVRIDRLARSLSHLLEVIERLEGQGAYFRSLQDPIDTASPQGKFTLQVLGAAAEELSLKVGDGEIGWHIKALFTRRSSRREKDMPHDERYGCRVSRARRIFSGSADGFVAPRGT
jgi:hypothetical protein